MDRPIYSDCGARFGRRTRLFRECQNGGIEWLYAVDHAAGHRRWYGFGPIGSGGIAALKATGMTLTPYSTHSETAA